jgi:hypothetical protein
MPGSEDFAKSDESTHLDLPEEPFRAAGDRVIASLPGDPVELAIVGSGTGGRPGDVPCGLRCCSTPSATTARPSPVEQLRQ